MSRGESGTVTRKVQFLVLTFGISSALVFGLALSASVPAHQEAVAAPERAASVSEDAHVVPAQRSERDLSIPPAPKASPDPALFLPNIADIAERANGAVVNIRATEIIRSNVKNNGKRRQQDPFDFFFPRPDGRNFHSPEGEDDDDQRQDSGGTGFVVTRSEERR